VFGVSAGDQTGLLLQSASCESFQKVFHVGDSYEWNALWIQNFDPNFYEILWSCLKVFQKAIYATEIFEFYDSILIGNVNAKTAYDSVRNIFESSLPDVRKTDVISQADLKISFGLTEQLF